MIQTAFHVVNPLYFTLSLALMTSRLMPDPMRTSSYQDCNVIYCEGRQRNDWIVLQSKSPISHTLLSIQTRDFMHRKTRSKLEWREVHRHSVVSRGSGAPNVCRRDPLLSRAQFDRPRASSLETTGQCDAVTVTVASA